MAVNKWIGVDFDQTLRHDDGRPIDEMVDRVRSWILRGYEVRIVTARLNPIDQHSPKYSGDQIKYVQDWCLFYIGVILPVQWGKSAGMIELWDDKVVAVEQNTGRQLSRSRVEGEA